MKQGCILYFFFVTVIVPSFGFPATTLLCSFNDSANVYREFMLKRDEANSIVFVDPDKTNAPSWKVMSDDKSKLILFRDMEKPGNAKENSIHSIFFIDKSSGSFRFRNYVHTEYINTVRGNCRLR